jgi:hypothetical protein
MGMNNNTNIATRKNLMAELFCLSILKSEINKWIKICANNKNQRKQK